MKNREPSDVKAKRDQGCSFGCIGESPDFSRIGLALVALGLVAGCASAPSAAEKTAHADVVAIGAALPDVAAMTPRRPLSGKRTPQESPAAESESSDLKAPDDARTKGGLHATALRADSPEGDFVRFAIYHHPAVRAAYYDWKASVEAIAPTRALPDPQFTFQADIAGTLMSFMPGLMAEVMAPGKRAAMADEATATSNVVYRTYVSEVVKTAAAVRKAWIDLAYANDTDRLYRQTIHAAEQAVALAAADYTTGRGMANFETQVRFQNTLAQHHAHHAGVAQRLAAARAQFKAALGLLPTDADPAWPDATLNVTTIPAEDELWRRVLAANPDLAKMRAMVDMAVAGVEVARKGATLDFTAGLMVDTKQNPLMFRPTATLTLPIWREKIRATIAAAEARRDAAAARVTSEELNLAAELAQMLYMIRDGDSMLAYMNETALPNFDRSLASAEAAVQSGMGSPTMIAETQLMAIDMRHEVLDALRDRESAVVELALMINDVLPDSAPLVAARVVSSAR